MAGFRFAFRLPEDRALGIDDVRWALLALEPGGRRMRYGAFTASDGAEVPYRLWLPKRPRAALILLHGVCDYSGAFDAMGPKLARAGFAVLAYDQRGFGASSSRGDWAGDARLVEDVANAAQFLRERLSPGIPLFLIGESMGGAIAIHAAASQAVPQMAGMVLVAPGALASPLRHSFYGWLIFFFRQFGGESELVFERLDSSNLTASAAIRLLGDPLVMRSVSAEVLEGVIALARSAVDAARQVEVPTLTMVGGKDDLLRRDCILQLHENLAGPRAWADIADGPHLLLHWKRGGEVMRTARRWIERHL
ncbi:MAG TPA: alpha/beta fold hydrolase [Rhizomicrobium sp.]|nr:alpha/beta fold hydrolase [Rhizomicrobium sp.]